VRGLADGFTAIRALFNWLLGGWVDQAKPGERLRASKAKLTGG